jgi:hypothetical protein
MLLRDRINDISDASTLILLGAAKELPKGAKLRAD